MSSLAPAHILYPLQQNRRLFLEDESNSARKQSGEEASSASLTSHTIKHTVAILTPKIQLTDLYSNGSIPSQLNGKIDSRLQWLSPVCCFAPQMWLNKFHHYSNVRCDIQKYAYATQHLEMVEGIRPKHWPLWSISLPRHSFRH